MAMAFTEREFVHIDLEDGVATLTFDRPPVNAMESESSGTDPGCVR